MHSSLFTGVQKQLTEQYVCNVVRKDTTATYYDYDDNVQSVLSLIVYASARQMNCLPSYVFTVQLTETQQRNIWLVYIRKNCLTVTCL